MTTAAMVEEAIKDWGVNFRPYPFSDRPWHEFTTPGGWAPIGVMHHHTTGPMELLSDGWNRKKGAMLRLLRIGRPGLDGPLCHFAPTYMGHGKRVVYGIGWGNVNHAGMGRPSVASAVRVGKFDGGASGPDGIDGNTLFWGLEYVHPGLPGIRWPDELLEAGHRTAAAICEASGWSRKAWAGSNIEHREWSGRKPDRAWDDWGGGLRVAMEGLAVRTNEPEIDGWMRNPIVVEAIRKLVYAADWKEARGRKHQAAALREHARELRKQFPVTRGGE